MSGEEQALSRSDSVEHVMFFTSSGSVDARPVFLLHGGGVAGWMWDSLRDSLQPDYAVLVPDLPGHGRSAAEPYVSHRATVTELAQRLTTTLGGQPATVIGFSLGAQLTIELAARHPDLVDQVIVVSAQAKPLPLTRLTLGALRLSAPLARRRWFAKLQARELFIPPQLMDDYIDTSARITTATLLAAVGENMSFQVPAEWSDFPGRALIMVGRRERRVMRDSAEAIHAALSGSELMMIDGDGHGIPFRCPEQFTEHVRRWLARS